MPIWLSPLLRRFGQSVPENDAGRRTSQKRSYSKMSWKSTSSNNTSSSSKKASSRKPMKKRLEAGDNEDEFTRNYNLFRSNTNNARLSVFLKCRYGFEPSSVEKIIPTFAESVKDHSLLNGAELSGDHVEKVLKILSEEFTSRASDGHVFPPLHDFVPPRPAEHGPETNRS